MEPYIKNGVVYIDIAATEPPITMEEAILWLKNNNTTAPFIETWISLFGSEAGMIENAFSNLDYTVTAEIVYNQLLHQLEEIFTKIADTAAVLANLNSLMLETMQRLEQKMSGPAGMYKDKLALLIKWVESLRDNAFYLRQSDDAKRRLNRYSVCADFKEMIERFGNRNELMKEYQSGISFAPNKRLYIEKRIKSQTETLAKRKTVYNSWWPKTKDTFQYDFGEYERIGYAWVIGGYNATWTDFNSATRNNVTLNAAVPVERRPEFYATLVHAIILGGSLGFHIAFLEEELEKLSGNTIYKSTPEVLPAPTDPDSIFISYNHANKEDAALVFSFLKDHGITTILDSDAMPAGQDIKFFIENAVKNISITLALVSRQSLLSGWVSAETINTFFMERLGLKKRFIAICLDNSFMDSGFGAEAIRHIDEQLGKIKILIQQHDDLGVDSRNLNTEKSRLIALRNNMDEILNRLKNSLCLDGTNGKIKDALPALLRAIKA